MCVCVCVCAFVCVGGNGERRGGREGCEEGERQQTSESEFEKGKRGERNREIKR